MPSVSQRTVRAAQPQTAVGIDWSNPITRGLVACLDANRRVLINGSETKPLTLTNPVRRASQQEYGSTTYQASMQAIKAPAASSNVTMLSLFIPSTEVTERTYGQLGHITTGNMFSVASGDGTTSGVVRFKIYLGATRIIGASQANADVPNLAIARHINGQSQNLWLNGIKDGASGAFAGNGLGFGFYGFNQSSGTGGASILNAVWNRALTDTEIKSLSENPWQIFAPERRVIAFDGATSPGGDVTLTGSNSDCATSSSTDSINVAVSLSSSSSSAQCDSSVGNITLSYDLSANTSTVECVSSTSAITQGHLLIGSASSSATTSSTGTVTTGSGLVCNPDNVAITSSIGSITQAHQLAGSTNSVASTASIGGITQVHSLVGSSTNITTDSAVGVVSSGLIINLVGSVSNCVVECATGIVAQSQTLISSACNVVSESLSATVSVVNNLVGSASIVLTESIGKSIFLPDGYKPSLTRTSSVAGEIRQVAMAIENRRFTI
jgi:hypothetical protein